MADFLTFDDLDDTLKSKVYAQNYSLLKEKIGDVQIIPVKDMIGDEGDFSELMRFNDQGECESVPGFKIAQINRTRLFPQSVKAWHVHLKQDEMWYVPPTFQLFVGLWDLRKNSPTKGKSMRINLGGGISSLLFIPKGVAHGSANFSQDNIELFYFVNQKFNIEDPDEKRLPWNALGEKFWEPERD